ncbi:hypothetical protein PZB74_11960 [Porifericola rhodea]|uniref:hypothetical protein n=1 Tax=Porifericola rhodea TaxID=930972 RepID=UPI002666E720|nr:hypothetical protein [Porifericola rhodea]WKN29681.1 hypothetical protein PZB74_11960 [Porifericola rhodea]
MKNKALAYDYIHTALYRDINIVDQLSTQQDLTEEDQNELAAILEGIRQLSNTARAQSNGQPEAMKQTEGFILKNMENTYQTIISLKDSLQDVIKDAKGAYRQVLWMYMIAFYLGIGLIITAIVFAARGQQVLAVAFGAIGLLDIVSHFIYKPPLDLQSSRSNLAQLMIALTNWFSDTMNLNSYMSIKGAALTYEDIDRLSTKQNANTEQILSLIEKYCEPGNLHKQSPIPETKEQVLSSPV